MDSDNFYWHMEQTIWSNYWCKMVLDICISKLFIDDYIWIEIFNKIAYISGRFDIQGGGSIYFGIQHGELKTQL